MALLGSESGAIAKLAYLHFCNCFISLLQCIYVSDNSFKKENSGKETSFMIFHVTYVLIDIHK